MIECRAPKTPKEFEQYFQLRWQVLRAPWHQAKGSEQDELESQAVHRMVINDQQQILAVGRLHFCDDNQAQIRYMAVDPAYHGQGLGRTIIDALEGAATEFGVNCVRLNAREQALDFYRRLGYQGEQLSHVLYGEIKHFKMKKNLAVRMLLSEDVSKLVNTWHSQIPLSNAMAIQVTYYDQSKLVTTCDQNVNKNLHQTMFAGSIYTLATLTGWGWIYLLLAERTLDGDIVLADSDIKYLAPIEGVAYAVCDVKNDTPEFSRLLKQRNEKIMLTVNVYSGEKVAACFHATYVVKPTV
ncbi:YiiD C-terminal domain-containing protein [Thalassotalea piscium]